MPSGKSNLAPGKLCCGVGGGAAGDSVGTGRWTRKERPLRAPKAHRPREALTGWPSCMGAGGRGTGNGVFGGWGPPWLSCLTQCCISCRPQLSLYLGKCHVCTDTVCPPSWCMELFLLVLKTKGMVLGICVPHASLNAFGPLDPPPTQPHSVHRSRSEGQFLQQHVRGT